jgi:hypothetical protein
MRFGSLSVLLLSSVVLAGCGGGGSSGIANLSSGLGICGQGCPIDPNTGAPVTPAPTGGGTAAPNLPPPSTVNTGNQTQLTTGDTAILLEGSQLLSHKNADGTNKFGLIRLTETENTPAVAGQSLGDSASAAIDTQDPARNGSWPTPKTMAWQASGQLPSIPGSMNDNSVIVNNNPVTYDEYKSITRLPGGGRAAEELQVWSWNKSYVAQYRDVTGGGGDATHQAWFFGANGTGTKSTATDVAVGGTLTLAGRYTGNAKTGNMEVGDSPDRTLDVNGIWSTVGTSAVNIDLTSRRVNVILTPTHYIGEASLNGATGERIVDVARARSGAGSAEENANYFFFMSEQLRLGGTLTADANGNAVTNGSATFDPSSIWITDGVANNFQGALFGNAETNFEFAGAYATESSAMDPYGGLYAHSNNGLADFSQSGVVHAQ